MTAIDRILAVALIATLIFSISTDVRSYAQRADVCELLATAQDEAQMAEAWHLRAGNALKRCGIEGAVEKAESKACYARRFNDDSVVCE